MKTLTYFKFYLWYFSRFKVPMIGYVRPQLMNVTEDEVTLKLPLTRRSKNHLHSMYFGALAVGADLAGGLHALYYAKRLQVNISFAFKSFEAKFLKRPEFDVYFVSKMGKTVAKMIEDSKKTSQRMNQCIQVTAYTHQESTPEVVAEFLVELSLKVKT